MYAPGVRKRNTKHIRHNVWNCIVHGMSIVRGLFLVERSIIDRSGGGVIESIIDWLDHGALRYGDGIKHKYAWE